MKSGARGYAEPSFGARAGAAAAPRGSAPRGSARRQRRRAPPGRGRGRSCRPTPAARADGSCRASSRRRCPRRADALRRARTPHSLTIWQTIRAQHQARRVADPAPCACRARRRIAPRWRPRRGEVGRRPGQLDEPARPQRRQRVEADRRAARGPGRRASPAAHSTACGAPCSGGSSGSAPQSTSRARAARRRPRSGARRSQPASRPRPAARSATADVAGDDHQPVAAAGRRRAGVARAVRAVGGSRTSRARSCARGGRPPPSARPGATGASAARRSSARRRTRPPPRPVSIPDQVHELERAHPEVRRPAGTMRSTSSTVAIRSWTSCMASRPNGRLQRLTRKPGPSATSITCLPIASPAPRAIATAAAPVWTPADDLEQRHDRGRVEEVHPDDAVGPRRAAADRVMGIEEVLVASTQSSATISRRARVNSSALTSRRSGAASMTSSHGPSACRSRRSRCSPSAASAAFALQRPRSAPRRRLFRMRSSARSAVPSTGSCSSVRAPAGSAASCAIPAPIVPAPKTPTTWVTPQRLGHVGHERVDAGHRAADDQLLDLRGALVERRDAHVAEALLDGMVVDVARAAVDLDRGVRALHRRLGGVELGDRGLRRVRAGPGP